MVTSPAVQLDTNSLDTVGLSVATSPPSASDARQGSAYNTDTFAAAAPVWLHPLYNGNWLMISGMRWYNATPVGGTPGSYSAYSIDTTPTWVEVASLAGYSMTPPGQFFSIPMNTTATDVTLVGGASRPNNILFLLNAATVAGQSTAVLQRFNLDINRSIAIAVEEVLPFTDEVSFTAGIQMESAAMVVYGTDASHQVYKITKPWAQVGFNKVLTPQIPKYTVPDVIGTPQGWQYFTGTGYTASPTGLAPLVAADGSVITTHGPLSFATWRNQTFMTTVNLSGTVYTGQVWRSRSGQPFAPYGDPIALGDSGAGDYLGGGVALMGQLTANPAAAVLSDPGVVAGIPYVAPVRTASGGGHILDTQWNILPVTA